MIILILSIPIFLFSACYTYSKGNLIDYKEIPNTKTLLNTKFDVKTISKPTKENPSITFKIERNEKYKVTAIPRYQKMKKSWQPLALGALLIGVAYFSSDTLTGGAFKVLNYVFGASLIIWNFFTPPKPTNEYIQGTPEDKINESSNPSADEEFIVNISFSNKSISKKTKTDLNGLLNVNLADLLAEYNFYRDDEVINVKILKKNETLSQDTIYVKEIAKQFALIKFDKVFIFSQPSAQSKIIGTAYKDQTYPIISIQNDWITIKLDGNLNGYIFTQTAETVMKIINKK
jgi:hypothetical protein